ncbi:hypothetical protein DL771_004547 [Monosporascus sp. 5C6A]|nr:hypothetical protein DL771_004547 [Monosporascus sp. 5C6A]
MSGFEFIVGVIIGGIPVILEAYDRYWTVSTAFKTFRQHSRELVKLDTILNTQKFLFRSNVTKLLTAVTNDPEKARNLLSEDPNWDDFGIHGISRARADGLRDAFASWKANLDQIHGNLQSICAEIETFHSSCPTGSAQRSSISPLKQLPKQFKLCFKKDEVQEAIEDLRHFTADFNELTTRITEELHELHISKPSFNQTAARIRPGHWSSLESYRQIRAASSRLYETFVFKWSCAMHQRHAVSIAFQGNVGQAQPEKGIKFDVAISPLDAEASPLWLEIEYIDVTTQLLSESHSAVDSDSDKAWYSVIGTLQKYSQPMSLDKVEPTPKKLTKRPKPLQALNIPKKAKVVRFQTASSEADETPVPDEDKRQEISASEELPVRNLDRIQDFCRHFQTTRSGCGHACVGYIKHSGLHRFYLPASQRISTGSQMTLAEIISWISEDEVSRSLPRTAMAYLASSLACAVLQYHSTPWLPETWQSSHVRFFGVADLLQNSTDLCLTPPYFKVEFPKLDKGKDLDLTPPPRQRCAEPGNVVSTGIARNEVLFRFGIVLLELGYSKPWSRLRQPVLNKLPLKKQTDFHAAEKLAQTPFLRDKMGPRYHIIVRKCLGCDFGLGENDLENEELQGAFLLDVVNALQCTERRLKDLEARII